MRFGRAINEKTPRGGAVIYKALTITCTQRAQAIDDAFNAADGITAGRHYAAQFAG